MELRDVVHRDLAALGGDVAEVAQHAQRLRRRLQRRSAPAGELVLREGEVDDDVGARVVPNRSLGSTSREATRLIVSPEA